MHCKTIINDINENHSEDVKFAISASESDTIELKNKIVDDGIVINSKQIYDNNGNIITKSKKKQKAIRKDSVPMKLRALPESFWQQPNEPAKQSPGTVCPELPLPEASNVEECSSTSTVSSCSTLEMPSTPHASEMVSTANTDLLFSLFSVVDTPKNYQRSNLNSKRRRYNNMRRGRSKKFSKAILRDADPCLNSTVTETLLPLLPERPKDKIIQSKILHDNHALLTVSVNNANRTTTFSATTITSGHSYMHLLSEVVIRL